MREDAFLKVCRYADENRMLCGVSHVIAGVSGGRDSMAMLDILGRIAKERGFSVIAVHVNHGIRGEEASRDQKVVEHFCRTQGILYSVYCYDVPALAKEKKMGLEETGRQVRKEAFAREKQKIESDGNAKVCIAIAHNQNDLAETVLHNLARGSGIRGLSSMRPVRGEMIRPLLCLKRTEIDSYVESRCLPSVLDSSNLEDEYTRNRIRKHILPAMEQEVNARTAEHLAEISAILGQAEDYFKKQAQHLAGLYRESKTSYILPEEFFEKEEIIKSYLVREILEGLSKSSKDLTAVHIKAVLSLFKRETGKQLDLPYQIRAKRCYEGVRIFLLDSQTEKMDPAENKEEAFLLVPGGEIHCRYGSFTVKKFPYNGEKILEKKYTKWFDCDKIKSELSVRTRKSGDYLVLNETGEHKKLTRYMIDEKIPAEEREQVALVASGAEILWVVGGRISERYKITSGTREVLEITYQGGHRNGREN